MRNTVKGFRLDDKVLSELKTESREKRITLNNHVNNILAVHNETYRNLQKLHYIWLSPELLQLIINHVPERGIKKTGDVYLKDLKKQVRYCHGDLDSHSIMDTIENICCMQDIPVNIKEFTDGSKQYTIIHGLGKKWSMIQKYALEKAFSEINTTVTKFCINCDHITFTINHQ